MFTKTDAELLRIRLGEPFVPYAKDKSADLFAEYFSFYHFDSCASIKDAAHSAGKFSIGADEVVVQTFLPNGPQSSGTVFIVHGYLDHAGLYTHIIDFCLERGFTVIVFDQIGHGLSTGEPASIDSFDRYNATLSRVLQLAKEAKLPRPWNCVGQSTGGAVIISSLLKGTPPLSQDVESYVLLAPLLRPFAWKKSRLLFAISKPFLASTKRAFSINSHDEKFLDFLKHKDPLQSQRLKRDWILAMINYQKEFAAASKSDVALKIVQGTEDTTVDWKYNIDRLAAKFPNAEVHLVEKARHHLVNESEDYRDKVFSLLDSFLVRAEAGA